MHLLSLKDLKNRQPFFSFFFLFFFSFFFLFFSFFLFDFE